MVVLRKEDCLSLRISSWRSQVPGLRAQWWCVPKGDSQMKMEKAASWLCGPRSWDEDGWRAGVLWEAEQVACASYFLGRLKALWRSQACWGLPPTFSTRGNQPHDLILVVLFGKEPHHLWKLQLRRRLAAEEKVRMPPSPWGRLGGRWSGPWWYLKNQKHVLLKEL